MQRDIRQQRFEQLGIAQQFLVDWRPDGARCDVRELASRAGDAVMARLGGRLRRGIAISVGAP